MGHDVFISYSSRDRKAADELCRSLETGRVRVWIAPRNLEPSSTWAQAIPSAIEASRLVVLVFSKHSDGSEWVAREIQHAVSNKKRILMVRLADEQPSAGLKFFLNTLHWFDAFPGGLPGHLPRLVKHSQDLLEIRASSKSPLAVVRKPPPAPVKPEADLPPAWRDRRVVAAAAAVAVVALAGVWGGLRAMATSPRAAIVVDGGAGLDPKAPAIYAGECSSTYGDAAIESAMKNFRLPDVDNPQGAYDVLDVSTLKVGDRIIKLSRIGHGDARGAASLRNWLSMSGPTIACEPADARNCRYRCEAGDHEDISDKILSSNWANPTVVDVSSPN